jgi:hypothetical protein
VLDSSLNWVDLDEKVLVKYKTYQNEINIALDG